MLKLSYKDCKRLDELLNNLAMLKTHTQPANDSTDRMSDDVARTIAEKSCTVMDWNDDYFLEYLHNANKLAIAKFEKDHQKAAQQ